MFIDFLTRYIGPPDYVHYYVLIVLHSNFSSLIALIFLNRAHHHLVLVLLKPVLNPSVTGTCRLKKNALVGA
jgi:hypothetical protein